MVDTIVLNIPTPYKKIERKDWFSPNLGLLHDPRAYKSPYPFCAKFIVPNELDTENEYVPQLTFISVKINVGRKDMLLIQFSAPKLLFGNNLEEISEDDFPKIIEVLHQRLKKMGVNISHDELISSKVSRIDPSKNIVIDSPVSLITQEIEKADVDLRINKGHKFYSNEGDELNFATKSYCVSFYDKGSELNAKKQPSCFQNTFQNTALCRQLNKKEKYILRMEVRFGREKLASVCRQYGLERSEVVLKNFFQGQICKKILMDYWQKYTKDLSLLSIGISDYKRTFLNLKRLNPNMTTAVALRLMMTMLLIKKCGFRCVRKLFGYTGEFNKNSSWSRLRKELKIYEKLDESSVEKEFENIQLAIGRFQPLRLESLES